MAVIAALCLYIELVFIVGQARWSTTIRLPFSRIRAKTAPVSREYLDVVFGSGMKFVDYSSAEIHIPGASFNPTLTLFQATDIFYHMIENETREEPFPQSWRAGFHINVSEPSLSSKPLFSITPRAPMNETNAQRYEYQIAVEGLNSLIASDLFVPMSWITASVLQNTIDSVAKATQSESCNWSVKQVWELKNELSVLSSEEKCYSTITAISSLSHTVKSETTEVKIILIFSHSLLRFGRAA